MNQRESGRLSLADILTLADDLRRRISQTTDDGREVLTGALEQMSELTAGQGPAVEDAYRSARRSLESEWVTAESVLDDTVNECTRAIHSFVTQADFIIRRFENTLPREDKKSGTTTQGRKSSPGD
ncbi:MAG: hypothetical protein ACR2PZ_21180 [Pseudomonadales bacterium]